MMHALNIIPTHLGFKGFFFVFFSYLLTFMIMLLVELNFETQKCVQKYVPFFVVFVQFNLAVLTCWPSHRIRNP